MSYANVVATLAMVFAMTGGAYAASKFLITSTKQIKPSVLAQLKGKNGKNGTVGVQGPAGAVGSQGPAGANGKDGAPGVGGAQGPAGPAGPKGATGAAGAPGPAGAKGAIGASGPAGPTGAGGPTGPEGSPWTDGGTLPSGKTETGTWAVTVPSTASGAIALAPVSFTIPLASGGKGFYIDAAETAAGEGPVIEASGCTGSAVKPTAPAGTLCVYAEGEEETGELLTSPAVTISEEPDHYGTAGSFVGFFVGENGFAFVHGVWAVTAS